MDYLIRDMHDIIKSCLHVPKADHVWFPTSGNGLKLTFDGSLYENLGQSGIGGSIYDSTGSCIMVFSSPLEDSDALLAELKVVLFGLRLIHFRGLSSHYIEVEGDSKVIIKWMKNEGKGLWRPSHLLKETAHLVSSLNISFKWIPRKANVGADRLAKRGVTKESMFMGSIKKEKLL